MTNTAATRIRTRLLSAGVVLAAAAGLTACSSSGGGTFAAVHGPTPVAEHSTVHATSHPAPPPTTPPAPTTDPASSLPADPAATIDSLLLTADEVGGGFGEIQGDTSDVPFPCTPDQGGPLSQVPTIAHAQADFATQAQDVLITERVIAYIDADDAARAVEAARRGFGCPTAQVDGAPLQIVGPTDISGGITATVNSAQYWLLRSESGDADLVIARVDRGVVTLQVATAPGATILIDPNQLLQTAIAKAINGG